MINEDLPCGGVSLIGTNWKRLLPDSNMFIKYYTFFINNHWVYLRDSVFDSTIIDILLLYPNW